MSRFTDILLVSPLADGSTWVIMRDFGYDVGAEASGDHIEVAVGFQTDFATIPRPFWIILPKWGRYGNATVIHDWLYWTQARPRPQADAIFLEAMGVLGVSGPVKYTLYWAVRLFGGLAWYRNAADRAAGFDRVLPDVHLRAVFRSERRGTLPGCRAAAPLTATSPPAAAPRRTARSDPTASGSAYCPPENPPTKRPPRISPRASRRRYTRRMSRHGTSKLSRCTRRRNTRP